MAISVPQLDVYYIDISNDATDNDKNDSTFTVASKQRKKTSTPGSIVRPLVKTLIPSLFPSPLSLLIFDLTADSVRALKRLIEEERFYIIRTSDELAQFENACGNDWITGKKALKRKQYYIRHPKKSMHNLLIESQYFYEYIEHEEKDELIDYIFSHCSAKSIQIDRSVVVETNGNGNIPLEVTNISASANGAINKGNYYSYSNPKGSTRTNPRNEYFWLDKSIMRSIANLSEGATLVQTYECDYRFGLTAKEASSLGLDIKWHKKFAYTLHIEC